MNNNIPTQEETINVSELPNFSEKQDDPHIVESNHVIQTLAYEGKVFEARVIPYGAGVTVGFGGGYKHIIKTYWEDIKEPEMILKTYYEDKVELKTEMGLVKSYIGMGSFGHRDFIWIKGTVSKYETGKVPYTTKIEGPRQRIVSEQVLIQTNFFGHSIDMLKMYHPLYGWIYKSQIGRPFTKKIDGSPLKNAKWILKSFNCSQITLEASIGLGLYRRKVYKFI